MKPPLTPPALTKLVALKDKLEAERVRIFPMWKAALEAAHGNVAQAARDTALKRDRAMRLTRRLGLVEYAAKLRLKAGAGARVLDGERKGKVMGRPRKSEK